VTYGGNCVGIGALVPCELNAVLDNRMGDCKDHATLMQALLAARGIDSQQVLVNAGNLYRLFELLVVAQVNHVINYVPELKLFMDATAKDRPYNTQLHGAGQARAGGRGGLAGPHAALPWYERAEDSDHVGAVH
jgi:transglutaminase-like putative cysteine protease